MALGMLAAGELTLAPSVSHHPVAEVHAVKRSGAGSPSSQTGHFCCLVFGAQQALFSQAGTFRYFSVASRKQGKIHALHRELECVLSRLLESTT